MFQLNSFKQKLTFLLFIPFLLVGYNNCSEMSTGIDGTAISENGEGLIEGTPEGGESSPQEENDQSTNIGQVAFFDMKLTGDQIENSIDPSESLKIFGAQTSEGTYGTELVLDGQSYASIGALKGLKGVLDGLSFSLIARSDSNSSGWHNLVALGENAMEKAIWMTRNGGDLWVGIQGAEYIRINNFFSDDKLNNYHHFVFSFNGESLKLYVDGLLIQTERSSLNLEKTQLLIGRPINGKEEFWSGSIAKFRIYGKALDVEDVLALYYSDFVKNDPASEPIDGKWSAFSSWSACPQVNCGGSIQLRTRTCSAPAPANGGLNCEGESSESRACPIQNCPMSTPVDGGWSAWVNQGHCSKECGGGVLTQTRTCSNPAPANGGQSCPGSTTQVINCNMQACPQPKPTPNPDPLPPPPAVNYGQGGTVEIDHLAKQISHDAIKDLQARNTSTYRTKQSGMWSAVSTWEGGEVPKDNANVLIMSNHEITFDMISNARLKYVRVDGSLSFSTNKNTKMIVDTLISNPGSTFKVGELRKPIEPGVKAEILIADNGPISRSADPQQLGRGLILQGHVDIHGMKKKAYLPVDISTNNGRKVLGVGTVQIKVKGDLTNWRVGDEIVIMGTKRSAYQDERRTIRAINGQTLTLNSPLTFLHDTPSFQLDNVSGLGELHIYVGNLTRNILVHSEYKSYSDVKRRGHVMIMHVDGADIRYAAFHDLGRTDKRIKTNDAYYPGAGNPEGRYPLYFHHTGVKPGRVPFTAIGNSVTRSPGWGIVHQDGYGAINYNFVYDIIGAGIVSEDGNEVGEWIGNFVTNLKGGNIGKFNQITVQVEGQMGWYGIAYECQSRIINTKNNIAANAKLGWSFLGVKGPRGHIKSLRDDSPDHPYFKNPLIVTTRDPNQMQFQFNHRPSKVSGPMTPQFVNFNDNTAIAVGTALNSWHRTAPWTFELLNNVSRFTAWRVSQAFNFINYVGGYHVSHSLFVEVGTVFKGQEKTSKNHLVHSHIENSGITFSSSQFNLNDQGIFFGNTEKNVNNPLDGDRFPNVAGGGVIRTSSDTAIFFDSPKPRMVKVANLNPNINPSVVFDVAPKTGPNTGFHLKGNVKDSFGTRRFSYQRWLTGLGKDGVYNTADDKITVAHGEGLRARSPGSTPYIPPADEFENYNKSNTIPWKELLEVYGVYKKGGKWVMPIPIWLNNLYDGKPYPYLVDFAVSGAGDAQLSSYQLSEYPKVDLVNEHFGNPNVNASGSFKKTRTYYRKNWRVPVEQ